MLIKFTGILNRYDNKKEKLSPESDGLFVHIWQREIFIPGFEISFKGINLNFHLFHHYKLVARKVMAL